MSNNEYLTFSDDDKKSLPLFSSEKVETWNLLVVDDDEAVHEVTQLVLNNVTVLDRKIVIHTAYSAKQAKELMLSDVTFAFALIDVVMETENAGLSLVEWIRETKKDTNIRLVLRTGQPGEAPERDIISHYDIHDYKEKSELTSRKLFTLSHSCLRTYNDIIKAKEMQKMLRHSEKMEAVGQLASGIVHDFNNILGVILSNVELLQQTPLESETQARRINSISKAVSMGKDITNKLHSFTTNKLDKKNSVNISEIITKMGSVLSQLSLGNFQLDYQLDNNIWSTPIVVSDFEGALFNLIINAKDAILDNGNILIQTKNCVLDSNFCKLNPKAIAGEYVLLSITDNGEGMSTEVMQHIFDPFYTTKTLGTGLGLALVFRFINRSSGYITLDSKLGVGTTFKIYLPRA